MAVRQASNAKLPLCGFHKLIQGEPLIIVQDGKPIEQNLRSERLTLDDVMEEARAAQVETIDEIKWAVLEAGGKMTFIKK